MEKEKLKEHIEYLKIFQNKYVIAEMQYNYAKNKKTKNIERQRLEGRIMGLVDYIERDFELYCIITGEKGTDYSRALVWDEFKMIRYFNRDLSKAISKLEDKVNPLSRPRVR